MRKFLRLQLKTVLLLVALVTGVNMTGQTWTYDFGTAAGTHSSGESTTFFTGTPSGGGAYRVRIGSGSGNVVRANPGTSLGTLTEAQLTATTGNSTNKMGVSGWDDPSNVAYVKFKMRTTSTGNGFLAFSLGGAILSTSNNGYTNEFNNTLASVIIGYSGGVINSVNRRINGSNTAIASHGFLKDTDQEVTIYGNNGSTSTTYNRGGTTYTLNSQSWDLWVNNTKVSPANGWAKAANAYNTGNIAGFAFFGESSTNNAAKIFIDDLEYSNTLPSAPAAPTITTTAASFGPFCNASDNDITVAYTTTGTLTGTYRVQLSAAGGAFADATSNLLTTVSSGTGTITATFPSNGLATGNYRVRVINTDPATQGTDNGSNIVVSEQSFSTVTTAFGTDTLTPTSATVRGISSNGNCNPVAERGFVYSSTDTTPTNGEAGVITAPATLGDGVYTLELTGLTPGTTYYYRAYIRSGSTYLYGSTADETTESAPLLNISGMPLDHGIWCVNASGTPVQYTITNTGTVAASGVTVTAGGTDASMFAVSGLSSTTIAANGGTATYMVTFTPTSTGNKSAIITVASTTPSSNSPTSSLTGNGINTATSITTAAASAITATSATLGGNVTIEGCSPVTDRGVVIGTSSNPVINGTGVTKLGSGSGAGDFTVASGAILSPSTLYYVRAYAINSVGATVYGTQVNFTTPCIASALPFSEGFDAVSFPPTCWTSFRGTNNAGTVRDWVRVTTNTYNSSVGAAFVQWEDNTGNNNIGQDWLVTPAIEIPAAGAELTFQARRQYTDPGTFYVKISTTSQTSISGFSTDLLTLNGSSFADNTYSLQTIDLQAYAGQTVYLAFVSEQDNGPSWWIDDIHIEAGVFVPTLSTNGTTALTFGEEGITEESASQTFNVSGTTLSGAPGIINVASDSTDFEVSADNITFSPFINIAYTSETLTPTPVFVRFAPETTGAKSGTLTISGGSAATSPTVSLTGTGIIPAPVATAATEISNRKFRANWNTVDVADSYRLDVSKLENFGNEVPGSTITETFADIPFNSGQGAPYNSGYLERTWTGAGGITWTANKARTDETIDGRAITLQNTTDVHMVSSVITGGITRLQFDIKRSFGSANDTGTVTAKILYGTGFTQEQVFSDITYGTAVFSFDSGAINIVDDYIIRIENNTETQRPTIDNLAFTSLPGLEPSYVAGYENLLVEGPSQLVTGLEPNTEYFYRVRAVAGAETSGNSNVMTVTTTNFNTWDGAAWSLGTPPTVADNAIIEGNYNTGEEAPIEALNLTVDSGELTVAAETVVTVTNALTVGNGTVVVESNGMLMQAGTTNQNSGAVEVHRDSHPLYRGDYTIWSAPVAGQNVFDFSDGTVLSRFYTYNTTTNHFESMFASPEDTGGVNFAAGQGYLIRMPNGSDVEGYIAGTAPMTFDGEFTGVPNNGDIPVTLSADGLGFNAIGNPYPSMIDADEFLQRNAIDNQRIDGTLYFWRKKNGVEGDAYATYTYVGGAAGTGEAGSSDDPELEEPILTEVPNGRIQTGQGFLVKALIAGSQPLFANTLRMADFSQDDQFFRMANTTGVEKHRMWLNLKNPAGLVFQSLVGYMTGATNGLDTAIDGKRFDEAAAGFYSVAEASKLTIQGRALPFMASDVVPMGYKALTAGSHTITLSNMDGLFAEGQDIFLKDNVLGVTHNLKEAGYTFATEAGTFDERFEIVYAQALGTDTPVLDANSIVVYKQGSAINISSGTIEMTGVAVYDIHGRELYSKTGINSTEAVIANLQSAQQVLIVQITTAKGKVSKKIVF